MRGGGLFLGFVLLKDSPSSLSFKFLSLFEIGVFGAGDVVFYFYLYGSSELGGLRREVCIGGLGGGGGKPG